MRSNRQAFLGLVLSAALIVVLAGCAQDSTVPPVHAKDLGAAKGEVLVPYEPVVDKKITRDPSEYPMPAMPVVVTAEAAPGDAAAPADEYAMLAKQIVDDLSKAGYEQVVARFDETTMAQLPASQLQATWETLANQAGAFQSQGEVRRQQIQGLEAAIVTVQFERAALDVLVVFNPEKKVAGLRVLPPGTALPTEPQATPASDTPAETPAETPAAPADETPAGAAPDAPAPDAGGTSGSSGGMDMLPPTAPAPVGLGN